MGAWATARTDKAHAQLFRRVPADAGRGAGACRAGPGSVERVTAASRRDVLAVTTETRPGPKDRSPSSWTPARTTPGSTACAGCPRRTRGDTISDDGRWYALASADGSVRLWGGGQDPGPRLLTRGATGVGRRVLPSLDFSDDSSRLLRLHSYGNRRDGGGVDQRGALDVWNVPAADPVPGAGRVTAGRVVDGCRVRGRVRPGDPPVGPGSVLRPLPVVGRRLLPVDGTGATAAGDGRQREQRLHGPGKGALRARGPARLGDAARAWTAAPRPARLRPASPVPTPRATTARTSAVPSPAATARSTASCLAVGTLADDTWTAVVHTNDTSSESDEDTALWPRASTGRPLAVGGGR